ncbi:MAG TPA: tryptophan synthase subunit beta, partial [Caballeronia sp.]|nr:tryptophan synthase subunit beta [Caballeronia sp.]
MHKPDDRGYFGKFGGKFVPEVLIEALAQLERAMNEAFADASFWDEYHTILRDFVGRPSPVYEATRLLDGSGAKIVFKREDLN